MIEEKKENKKSIENLKEMEHNKSEVVENVEEGTDCKVELVGLKVSMTGGI